MEHKSSLPIHIKWQYNSVSTKSGSTSWLYYGFEDDINYEQSSKVKAYALSMPGTSSFIIIIVGVRFWEGPLWEDPMYYRSQVMM